MSYKCNKLGHIKQECPLLKKSLKKFNKKGKVMKATLRDSDSSSDEEEELKEMANLCLMAVEAMKISVRTRQVMLSLLMNSMMLLKNCMLNFKNFSLRIKL